MKKNILYAGVMIFSSFAFSMSACSKDSESFSLSVDVEQPGDASDDNKDGLSYALQGSMKASPDLVGKDYNAIHKYMRSLGWDYSEHPNSSEADHNDGVHCTVEYDKDIEQNVFRFFVHSNNEVLDGDRGKIVDRQRNEMKSQTTPAWYKLNGNWDEWQKLAWKFKIPGGFQPSSSFCHIHQLKAQEGNNGAPLITITLRSNSNGSNRRVQVIHTGDVSSANKGTIIDNLPFSDFENEWVQVETEMHYTHNGFFKIKMTRVRDGKILAEQSFDDIDLWRKGATSIRNKFGIYRSYGSKMSTPSDRPTNGIKDESLDLADFVVYEANTNPSPSTHD